jgi:hypothetical protein
MGNDHDQVIARRNRGLVRLPSIQNIAVNYTHGGDGGSEDGGVEQDVGEVLGKDDDDDDADDAHEDSDS